MSTIKKEDIWVWDQNAQSQSDWAQAIFEPCPPEEKGSYFNPQCHTVPNRFLVNEPTHTGQLKSFQCKGVTLG